MKEFIANLYELWGGCYFGDFSKYMFKADAYMGVFLWMIILPLVVFFIYYILLDHIKLSKTSIWACILIVVSLAVALIAFNIADTSLTDYLLEHKIKKYEIQPVDYFWFSFIVFCYTAIVSLIYSLLFKIGSKKSRRIPF